MSRTIRRKHLNSKKRFFKHYWEAYSDQEIIESSYLKVWQYHADNYYTKSCKDNKQFFKNLTDREIRREFNEKFIKIKSLNYLDDDFDVLLSRHNKKPINWIIH